MSFVFPGMFPKGDEPLVPPRDETNLRPIVYGSDLDEEDGERQRRQDNRETIGWDYLEFGKVPVLQSTTLRGPFSYGWTNPWLRARVIQSIEEVPIESRLPPAGFANRRRKRDDKELSLNANSTPLGAAVESWLEDVSQSQFEHEDIVDRSVDVNIEVDEVEISHKDLDRIAWETQMALANNLGSETRKANNKRRAENDWLKTGPEKRHRNRSEHSSPSITANARRVHKFHSRNNSGDSNNHTEQLAAESNKTAAGHQPYAPSLAPFEDVNPKKLQRSGRVYQAKPNITRKSDGNEFHALTPKPELHETRQKNPDTSVLGEPADIQSSTRRKSTRLKQRSRRLVEYDSTPASVSALISPTTPTTHSNLRRSVRKTARKSTALAATTKCPATSMTPQESDDSGPRAGRSTRHGESLSKAPTGKANLIAKKIAEPKSLHESPAESKMTSTSKLKRINRRILQPFLRSSPLRQTTIDRHAQTEQDDMMSSDIIDGMSAASLLSLSAIQSPVSSRCSSPVQGHNRAVSVSTSITPVIEPRARIAKPNKPRAYQQRGNKTLNRITRAYNFSDVDSPGIAQVARERDILRRAATVGKPKDSKQMDAIGSDLIKPACENAASHMGEPLLVGRGNIDAQPTIPTGISDHRKSISPVSGLKRGPAHREEEGLSSPNRIESKTPEHRNLTQDFEVVTSANLAEGDNQAQNDENDESKTVDIVPVVADAVIVALPLEDVASTTPSVRVAEASFINEDDNIPDHISCTHSEESVLPCAVYNRTKIVRVAPTALPSQALSLEDVPIVHMPVHKSTSPVKISVEPQHTSDVTHNEFKEAELVTVSEVVDTTQNHDEEILSRSRTMHDLEQPRSASQDPDQPVLPREIVSGSHLADIAEIQSPKESDLIVSHTDDTDELLRTESDNKSLPPHEQIVQELSITEEKEEAMDINLAFTLSQAALHLKPVQQPTTPEVELSASSMALPTTPAPAPHASVPRTQSIVQTGQEENPKVVSEETVIAPQLSRSTHMLHSTPFRHVYDIDMDSPTLSIDIDDDLDAPTQYRQTQPRVLLQQAQHSPPVSVSKDSADHDNARSPLQTSDPLDAAQSPPQIEVIGTSVRLQPLTDILEDDVSTRSKETTMTNMITPTKEKSLDATDVTDPVTTAAEPIIQSPWATNGETWSITSRIASTAKAASGSSAIILPKEARGPISEHSADVAVGAFAEAVEWNSPTFEPVFIMPAQESRRASTPESQQLKSFRDLMTPSPVHRPSTSPSYFNASPANTQQMVQAAIGNANPWASITKKDSSRRKSKKRVSFGLLNSLGETLNDETFDGTSSPRGETHTRLCSPPPPPEAHRILLEEERFQGLLNATPEIKPVYKPVYDPSQRSPDFGAMAEAFRAADSRSHNIAPVAPMFESETAEDARSPFQILKHIPYSQVAPTAPMFYESAGQESRSPFQSLERFPITDLSQESSPPHSIDADAGYRLPNSMEGLGDVVGDMGSFLEGWDVDDELEKARKGTSERMDGSTSKPIKGILA